MRTLVIRKDDRGWLFISVSQDTCKATVAMMPDEIDDKIAEVIDGEGPGIFTLAY